MILVVDDVRENVYSLQKVLEHHGFQVDYAFSGEEALRKILGKQYVLILLDVQMPGIDGFEVAENIKGFKKAKDTAVVFLSANYTDVNMIVKGYNQGAIDYITKPVDMDLLLLKVKTVYRLYEAKQDNSKKNHEIQVLYNHAQEYNQKLLTKVDKLNEVLELLGVAQWEYIPENERFIPSASLNKLFKGKADISIKKSELFEALDIKEADLALKTKPREVIQLDRHIGKSSENGKDVKVVLKVETADDRIKRILGVVQEVNKPMI